jgi:hypothetical protein
VITTSKISNLLPHLIQTDSLSNFISLPHLIPIPYPSSLQLLSPHLISPDFHLYLFLSYLSLRDFVSSPLPLFFSLSDERDHRPPIPSIPSPSIQRFRLAVLTFKFEIRMRSMRNCTSRSAIASKIM